MPGITTNVIFITNGLIGKESSSGLNYLTPPSKWILNKELIRTLDPSPNTPLVWDQALASQFLSKGDCLHTPDVKTYYSYHEEQATTKILLNQQEVDNDFLICNNYIKTLKIPYRIWYYRNGHVFTHEFPLVSFRF